jgi:rhodanese-related sulfurtransferase
MLRTAVLALVMTALAAFPLAAEEDTPKHLDGVKVLSADELKSLAGKPGLRIFDLRKKASFVEGHIPKAVSAASAYDEREKKLDVAILGSDKSLPIVFYSHGAAGWKSYWAAKGAVQAGYANVMWFRGGYAEWEERNLAIAR